MEILLLSGSGANGKTSLTKELQKIADTEGVEIATFLSTTRETFKRLGMTHEKLGLIRRADEQLELQNEVFHDYLSALRHAIDDANRKGKKLLIGDRSPMDYNGYVFQILPLLNADQVGQRMRTAWETLENISDHNTLHIWGLPHRPPWVVEDDGYRFAPEAKNLVWAGAVQMITQNLSLHLPKINCYYNDPQFTRATSSVERSQVIWNKLFTHLKG